MTTPTKTGVLQTGAVGTWHLVFFVIAAAAPLTVMTGFAPIAFRAGGEIAPIGYLIAGVVYAAFAVGFTTMGRHIRNAGAFYAYITVGLGRTIGAGSAMVAYLAYTLGDIGFCAVAGLFASNGLSALLGLHLPWSVCAIILGFCVATIAYCRVDVSARVLATLLLAEIGVLFALSIAILVQGVPEGYSFAAFSPSNWSLSDLGALFVITFTVYVGFEQTAVYSEEAADPARTVPRATYIALAILAFLYTFVSWILLMAIGRSGLAEALAKDPSTLVFEINRTYLGAAMTDVMQLLIVTSFFAGVLALHNASARYLFSLGRQGLLPRGLAVTNPQTGSPGAAVIVQSVILIGALAAFAASSFDPYTEIVVWTNIPVVTGILFLQILTSLAVIRYFAREPRGESPWKRIVMPTVAAIALSIALWLICAKMDLLSGLDVKGNVLINLPLLVAFVAGAVRAAALRRNDPAAWEALGEGQPHFREMTREALA